MQKRLVCLVIITLLLLGGCTVSPKISAQETPQQNAAEEYSYSFEPRSEPLFPEPVLEEDPIVTTEFPTQEFYPRFSANAAYSQKTGVLSVFGGYSLGTDREPAFSFLLEEINLNAPGAPPTQTFPTIDLTPDKLFSPSEKRYLYTRLVEWDTTLYLLINSFTFQSNTGTLSLHSLNRDEDRWVNVLVPESPGLFPELLATDAGLWFISDGVFDTGLYFSSWGNRGVWEKRASTVLPLAGSYWGYSPDRQTLVIVAPGKGVYEIFLGEDAGTVRTLSYSAPVASPDSPLLTGAVRCPIISGAEDTEKILIALPDKVSSFNLHTQKWAEENLVFPDLQHPEAFVLRPYTPLWAGGGVWLQGYYLETLTEQKCRLRVLMAAIQPKT